MNNNATLDLMLQHRSIRRYQEKPVPPDVLDAVLRAAWRAPGSMNSQQVSLVVVQDAARRARIAEIAGNQAWVAQAPVFIAIVADQYKTSLGVAAGGAQQTVHSNVEGFATAAVDVGIVLGNLMTAAHAVGLGVVPIGGIRRDPQAMIDLLGLPKLTFPLVGLTLGYAAEEGCCKPRLPLASFAHAERYDAARLPQDIAEYDAALCQHWQQIGRADGQAWSTSLAAAYSRVYFPQVGSVARAQGFAFADE